LFRDVRAGKVRIRFGSTQKMGTGANVQERLIALHHLDAPWQLADVEQREGRILRQGNRNAEVQIYRYVTEHSFDAYSWQTLEAMAKFIAQVMTGESDLRRKEDMDGAALTYAEVKAIASGNPLVIEKGRIDAEVARLAFCPPLPPVNHAADPATLRCNGPTPTPYILFPFSPPLAHFHPMSMTSDARSAEFLKIASQFQLGGLTTETSHPVTARLSDVAREDIAAGLGLLFEADGDVVRKYREFALSGRAHSVAATVLRALEGGGKMFFTGCGSTGRLSIQIVSIWRDFWQRQGAAQWEQRAFSVMAGGDFALIKAVEGFEDFTAFGRKQIADLGVTAGDVVFAITEGGETSFVIGTAWQGVDVGARVFFVYNNPDDVLCRTVQRSREVIEEPRIEKLNLTTGPMSITGSTRMQATSIQLCVMLTVLEIVCRTLVQKGPSAAPALDPATVPTEFLAALEAAHAELCSARLRADLAQLVAFEEGIYRAGRRNNYFADRFAVDVLTDTTERSPTYCTPPFRKFDDATAAESWAFLFVRQEQTPEAWAQLLKRAPCCVEWSEAETTPLVPADRLARTLEILGRIRLPELLRFRIGQDGLAVRPPQAGGGEVAVCGEAEAALLEAKGGFFHQQLQGATAAGTRTGAVLVGGSAWTGITRDRLATALPGTLTVTLPLPPTRLLLDGATRVALKLLLNALSTCTMVRLGRVMGNYMIWVVPSNLKLIDRATRYIQRLTSLEYEPANRLLFEVIEFVEPRMKADQAYPPVVGVAVMRQRHGLDNAQAEARLRAELGG
jgi:N-acetylmuramic acid 6-phosphate etherase